MRKRNNLDICADILRVARIPVRKTRIVYEANLNFKIVKDYLSWLEEKGLLRNEAELFITTQKGNSFINEYNTLMSV